MDGRIIVDGDYQVVGTGLAACSSTCSTARTPYISSAFNTHIISFIIEVKKDTTTSNVDNNNASGRVSDGSSPIITPKKNLGIVQFIQANPSGWSADKIFTPAPGTVCVRVHCFVFALTVSAALYWYRLMLLLLLLLTHPVGDAFLPRGTVQQYFTRGKVSYRKKGTRMNMFLSLQQL